MILLDSDILIEVTREHDDFLLARWRDLVTSDETIAYSPVTAAELWMGAFPREHKPLASLFGALVCLVADGETGRIAGEYLREYRRSHSLELGDALIAATATQHNAQLWTRNLKHYPMKNLTFY